MRTRSEGAAHLGLVQKVHLEERDRPCRTVPHSDSHPPMTVLLQPCRRECRTYVECRLEDLAEQRAGARQPSAQEAAAVREGEEVDVAGPR